LYNSIEVTHGSITTIVTIKIITTHISHKLTVTDYKISETVKVTSNKKVPIITIMWAVNHRVTKTQRLSHL